MAKFSSILQGRFQKKEKPKMEELGSKTSQGELTPFAGLFGNPKTSEKEEKELTEILQKYSSEEYMDFTEDLRLLLALTQK